MSEDDYEYDYSSCEEDTTTEEEDYDDDTWEVDDRLKSSLPLCSFTKPQEAVQMMPAEDLLPEMELRLENVVEVLDVSMSAANALLQKYNWSSEALLEEYWNNPEEVQRRCGVFYRCQNPVTKKKKENCPICYDDMDESLSMPCGHSFCMDCWHDYCEHAVQNNGPGCVQATCPDASCQEIITEREIELSAPPKILEKFRSFQLQNFVDSNASTRWCPGNGCERVAYKSRTPQDDDDDDNVAHCDACSISFCISCGEEPHDPCGCKELILWREKCQNDSETANWMTANTKQCPKCSTRIEKNGGCMYVTCRKCNHGFCWICMGTHHVMTCNKFVETDPEHSKASKAKGALERYLHYYVRYDGHDKSEKIARTTLKKLEDGINSMAIDGESPNDDDDDKKWKDVDFLIAANRQLIECRRVLKYTYAFAYYQFLNPSTENQKTFFEHHQGILEGLTEGLTKLTEHPEVDDVQVKNQTRVIKGHLTRLVDYIQNKMED